MGTGAKEHLGSFHNGLRKGGMGMDAQLQVLGQSGHFHRQYPLGN